MTSGIIINEAWVETQMRKLCGDLRKGLLDDCPLSINKDNCYSWECCVDCISCSLVGRKGAFFACPPPYWCEPDVMEKLHNCLQKSLKNIEWLLHMSQKRYRDHASHQLFVGALGWFFLHCLVSSSSVEGGELTLINWIAVNKGLSESEVGVAWWVSSLLHDHAYPLSHLLRIPLSLVGDRDKEDLLDQIWALLGLESKSHYAYSAIAGLYSTKLLSELRHVARETADNVKAPKIYQILTNYLTPFFPEDQDLPHDEAKNVQDCYDHGMLGAANLAALLSLPSQKNPILQESVRAIAIHNGVACHKRVSFEKDPLAFLLILCDEMQEWGRRIVVDDVVECESQQIRLYDLKKVDGDKYRFNGQLNVVFEYSAEILNKTNWDSSHFISSKKGALSRLCISDDLPIRKIKFRIPHLDSYLEKGGEINLEPCNKLNSEDADQLTSPSRD